DVTILSSAVTETDSRAVATSPLQAPPSLTVSGQSLSSDFSDFKVINAAAPLVGDLPGRDLEIFSEKICSRPGCVNTFPFDPHVPHKKFCCDGCYEVVRLARKRLLHWYRLTHCLYALEIYRLLGGLYEDSG
ncbi:MAG TPA: hypothetical protein DEB39_09590, partial [Planctomycetaceae bacterium]|nr:hypothetical protein [Planctomycetaceae bacterium]